MARFKFLLFIYPAMLLLDSCSSGKSAYERGNYYQAVITSVDRLRKNTDHDKSAETLRQAYPLALSYYEDRAKASLATNGPFKWTGVVESYTTINVMYEEIRRSPGALKVIPNPANYYTQLQEAKQNAAEENYAAGIAALSIGNRDKAKEAYGLFKNANGFVPGYKDVIKMMEEAKWAATLKVVVEPIPVQAKNISVSAEFFDDKISEYVHSASINEYVRFFTRKEAQQLKLNPDHIVKLEFDEFAVGQVFLYEKELKVENDSVLVGTYVAQQPKNTETGNKPTGGNTPPAEDKNTDSKNPTPAGNQANQDQDKNQNNEDKQNQQEDKSNSDKNAPVDSIAEKEQVTVCHIPAGNVANKHTLVISRSALNAHLAHGDVLGACEGAKDKGKSGAKDSKPKEGSQKPVDKKGDSGKGKGAQAWLSTNEPVYFASADNSLNWLHYFTTIDTTKIYSTVKATLYYSKKATTSKGVVSFKIIDAKTNALLAVEKLPGEYVWVSEWATFNGDERALTAQQLQWSKQKEKVPPSPQDLFIEFTRPIYDQVTMKLKNFYKGY